MPLITVTAGTPAIPAGTYTATLIGIEPTRMSTKFSKPGEEDDFLRWTWLINGADRDVEITSLTSIATGPKSRIVEYLTALLGADKVQIGMGLDENDLVGKTALVSTIVTEDGFSKIDKIVAPQVVRAAPAAAKTAPAKAPETGIEDDLPF